MSAIDYAFAAVPLVIGHIIIPPLSWFGGERVYLDGHADLFTDFYYKTVPSILLDGKYVHSLVADSKEPFNYRNITSIFVHSTYSHMFNNLSACLQFGLPVYLEFGHNGLYFVFLVGGAFASFPSFLHDDQKKELARVVTSKISVSDDRGPGVWRGLARLWNRTVSSPVGALAAEMAPTKSCGSSGAVCALMGCQLVLLLRDVSKVLVWSIRSSMAEFDFTHDVRNHSSRTGTVYHRSQHHHDEDEYNNTSTSSSSSSSRNRNHHHNFSSYRLMKILTITGGKLLQIVFSTDLRILFRNSFNVFRTITFWFDEANMIYPISTLPQPDALIKAKSLLQIGHSSHLQGLIFGSCFALVFGYLHPWLIVRRRRRDFDSNNSFDSFI